MPLDVCIDMFVSTDVHNPWKNLSEVKNGVLQKSGFFKT